MLREEAILKWIMPAIKNTWNEKKCNEILKALQQEPCDCISRAEAEALFREARINLNPKMYKSADEFNTRDLMLLNAEQMIHLLPSVQPKRLQKWIYSDLLRVKHGTMNIDALIDRVYADMRESEDKE